MNTYRALLILLVAFSSPLYATLSIGALLTKGSKNIVLLGDIHLIESIAHDQEIVRLDYQQSLLLLDWVRQIAHIHHASTMIVEAPKHHPETIKMNELRLKPVIPIMTLFPYLAQLQKYKLKNMSFIYGDLRTKEMYGFFYFMSKACHLEQHQTEELQTFKKYLFQEGIVLTVEAFIKQLTEVLQEIKENAALTLEPWFKKVETEIEHGKALLSKTDSKQFLLEALSILVCPSDTILKDIAYTYFQWIAYCKSLIASVGFMKELWSLLKNNDTVIVIAGREHIIDLYSFARQQNFTVHKEFGQFDSLYDTPHNLRSTTYTLGFIQPIGLSSFLNTVQAFLEKQEKKNACSVCNKASTNRCSRCKKVYYCSPACQTTDWPEHKKICQKD